MTDHAASAGPWITLKESPPPVRFLLLGVCVNQFGALLQAFLVLYLAHRGFTTAQAGFALGVYGVGAVAGVLTGGRLCDLLAPRLTIVVSMLAAALTTVAISLLGSYPAILAAVLMAGATTQAYRPAAAALLTAIVAPSRQVMVMALNRLAMNVGMLAGPLAAVALIDVSWNSILWADASTSVLYAGIALVLLPSGRLPGAVDSGGDLGRGYRRMLVDRRYLVYLTAMLTNALVHIQFLVVLPLTLRDAGYPTVVYSAVIATGTAIMVSSELVVTKATQRWAPRRAAALGSLLLGLGMVAYGVPGGIAAIMAGTVIAEVGQMIGGPTVFAWPAMAAPYGMAGRYLGAALAMFGLGQALGPAVGVLAYQRLGRDVWWLCGAMGIISAATCRYGMRIGPADVAATPGRRSGPDERLPLPVATSR